MYANRIHWWPRYRPHHSRSSFSGAPYGDGPRVPCVVPRPCAKKGQRLHELSSRVSPVALIERSWGLAPSPDADAKVPHLDPTPQFRIVSPLPRIGAALPTFRNSYSAILGHPERRR